MSSKRRAATVIGSTLGLLFAGPISPAWAQFDREFCFLPLDAGPCEGICPRYYYNAATGRCEEFEYGCCQGNENNFETLAECEAACVPTTADCLLPADVGPCDAVCPRYFYNANSGQCEPFTFGCCEGNANNFLTQQACEATCPNGLTQLGPIPTVSEWGLVAMTLLVLSAGTVVLRRWSSGCAAA